MIKSSSQLLPRGSWTSHQDPHFPAATQGAAFNPPMKPNITQHLLRLWEQYSKQPFERGVGLNKGAEICHSSSPKFIVEQVSDKLQLLMSHLEKDLVYSFSAPTFLAVIWPTDLSPFLRTWHTLFSCGEIRTKMQVWTSTIVWEALRISGQNNWWGLSHNYTQKVHEAWERCVFYLMCRNQQRVKENKEGNMFQIKE